MFTWNLKKRAWGNSVDDCRISLGGPKAKIAVGSPVRLDLIFQNDGDTGIGYPRVSIWFEYDFEVSLVGARGVPLTRTGQEKRDAMEEQGGVLLECPPHDRISSSVEISQLYDFKTPGEYEIVASKKVPGRGGSGIITVVSNQITVEVYKRN
ncbi:MAG: hypothetical protein IPK83_24685 [Planctomycetes bacterium]|nr:hypothetical protein [Planctomycetota bacterium]